jgi:thioredoxin-like negative regulator of GroEL
MRNAAKSGGFLLLVGDSSVGKSRLLYETALHCLPGFSVLAPDLGDGALVNTVADARFPLPRLLVWLDEFQRFLDGPYLSPGSTSITVAAVRRLLEAPTPVVIVGTLWPEYAAMLRSTQLDPNTNRQAPLFPAAVDILDPRRLHEIGLQTFSDRERRAAAVLQDVDPRLGPALAARDREGHYNVTEFLAGAPELIRRYERATEEQLAVLHSAVDTRRLGIQAPLTEPLLTAAARGYLLTVHRDDSWFPPTLDELTSDQRSIDRATAPLIPVPNPDRTAVIGYTVADYLLQRITRQRRSERLPAATWQALIDHPQRPDDMFRLADNAARRLQYRQAEHLYRRIDTGDGIAAHRLADLLARQGRIDEAIEVLRALVDTGDVAAARKIQRLAEQRPVEGQIEVLQALADARALATAGDEFARRLADLLAEQGRVEELRARVDHGDEPAAYALIHVLAARGRIEEAIEVSRARADAGNEFAARKLADLLAEQGRVEEAIEVSRARADAGNELVARKLADLLAEQGRVEELRARADAGDGFAARKLADLLAEQGHVGKAIEVLRARNGDRDAAFRLAGLLTEQGRVDEEIAVLRTLTDDGEQAAAYRLADALAEQGRVDEEIEVLKAPVLDGEDLAAYRLADLLAEHGRVEEMRARADAGDDVAAYRLAETLVERGHIEEAVEVLQAFTDADHESDAFPPLVRLLTALGRVEQATAVLRTMADAGVYYAASWLAESLADRGRVDEAVEVSRAFADTGDGPAAYKLVDLLAEQGRVDELAKEVHAGTADAASRLVDLLGEQGRGDEAERLRRFGFNPDGLIKEVR